MKKVIFILFLSLFSLISTAQSPFFGRAYTYYMAENKGGGLVLDETPLFCDILIQIDEQKVTIYSNILQEYQIIKELENKGFSSKFLAANKDGLLCHLYLNKYGNFGDLSLSVEFRDYGWVYLVTPQD